jgi:hypothetical protein
MVVSLFHPVCRGAAAAVFHSGSSGPDVKLNYAVFLMK